jgi:hypothetical protein
MHAALSQGWNEESVHEFDDHSLDGEPLAEAYVVQDSNTVEP